MQPQPAVANEFVQFKEELANMMKNKLGIDIGNTKLYKKNLIEPNLILLPIPLVGACLILLNLVVKISAQPRNT